VPAQASARRQAGMTEEGVGFALYTLHFSLYTIYEI